MGYFSLDFRKAKGASDSRMSDHIERRVIAPNVDPMRTHLNRELVRMPEGIRERDDAIAARISSAGIRRKITHDQVRAIRVMLSGTHEDMMEIEKAGRLDDWCRDSMDWLYRTFGRENVVSAVLHMDASATSIIYSGNPVFAVALAHFILHEPLKKNHLLAIGVELVGILFILNPAHLEISLRGFLEIITATLLFATYGTLCKLRLPRRGALVITTFNMLIGGLELLFLLLLGEIPAVGALYSGLGLEIFAGIPFFTGFTLKTTLLLCHVGIGCAAIGFLLTAKITEYTSATEASFVYLVKPILATALAVVVYHEHISVNRMVGIAFFVAASLCVSVPELREMRRERAVKT